MFVRRLLAPLAAMWLVCQLGTVTLVPVALWESGSDLHGVACTCGHGADAACPMHHKPASGSSKQCAMQSATPSGTAVLTTLVGIAGLLAERTHSISISAPSAYARMSDVHIVGRRPVPPDPPPPRV